jgi:hypothetical protein
MAEHDHQQVTGVHAWVLHIIASFGTTVCIFFLTNLSTVRSLSPQLQTLTLRALMFRLFAMLCARPAQLLLPDDAIAGNKWHGDYFCP